MAAAALGRVLVRTVAASRGVLRVSGEGPRDAAQFVQGLVTNDVLSLGGGRGGCMYAGMLNAKGRMLHDVFLYRQEDVDRRLGGAEAGVTAAEGAAHTLLADVDAASVGKVVAMWNRYKLRAKVTVEDVSRDYRTWVLFGEGLGGAEETGDWFEDPRLPALGKRMVAPAGVDPFSSFMKGIEGDVSIEDGSELFRAFRTRYGVAEGDTEIPSGEALPLEYNLDGLNGVSFKKGCYVGQELTARTHFNGVVRKRLMPVAFQGPVDPEIGPGTPVKVAGAKKPAGKIIAVCGDVGLAHLRLAPALAVIAKGDTCTVEGTETKLVPIRPSWWPAEWGHEGA